MSSYNERMNYIQNRDRTSSLDRSMNMLETVALEWLNNQNKISSEQRKEDRVDDLYERNIRRDEVRRLTGIHPDIDPNDFGEPIMNSNDYNAYLAEIKLKTNAFISAAEYEPVGGVVSQEAQRDLFSYGSQRESLDSTATILSREDLYNYDAWLLGGSGTIEGKKIAKRHNWNGLLNDFDDDYDGYILDEDDYIDLKEKGLVDMLSPSLHNSDIYVVTEGEKTNIMKKYEYWKKAFVATKQPMTKSQISGMITQNNIADQANLDKLYGMDQYKDAIASLNRWRPGSKDSVFGLVDDNDKFTTDYCVGGIDANGNCLDRTRLSKKRPAFMKEFPDVYSWMFSTTNFEEALHKVASNPKLMQQLNEMPQVKAIFEQQIQDYNNINDGKRTLGLVSNQNEWIQDSRIMGDARNMVLDDLQGIGNGILFNDEALNQADDATIDSYLAKLRELEAGYIDEKSMHYDMDVARFLSLYGYGTLTPGETLNSVINELKNEVPGRK